MSEAVSTTQPALGCGCHITKGAQAYFWHHCPLHAAAGALLDALEGVLAEVDLRNKRSDVQVDHPKARAAIRAAKGETG